jgi:hypothetical protein
MIEKIKRVSWGVLTLAAVCLTWSFVLPEQPAKGGKSKRFTITENKAGKRIDITLDGKPFTSYIYPDELKKPVLYPLRTATGALVTRGWPMDPRPSERVDHPHHVGMWFNYGDVNGLDFWNNSTSIPAGKKGEYGTILHRGVKKMTSGNDKAELVVTADWQKPDGSNLLLEETRLVFSGQGQDRTIERITKLTALKEEVSFKDNKEGMIGIRLARELEHPSNKPEIFTDASGVATAVPKLNNNGVTGRYISSEGKQGDAVWGTRGNWVNLVGTIGQEPVSVVLLDHPKNVGYPTYWHARGYGLYAANPLGQKAMSNGKEELNFKLAPGKSVTFRYKVLIHSGSNLTNEQVNAEFQKFSVVK